MTNPETIWAPTWIESASSDLRKLSEMMRKSARNIDAGIKNNDFSEVELLPELIKVWANIVDAQAYLIGTVKRVK